MKPISTEKANERGLTNLFTFRNTQNQGKFSNNHKINGLAGLLKFVPVAIGMIIITKIPKNSTYLSLDLIMREIEAMTGINNVVNIRIGLGGEVKGTYCGAKEKYGMPLYPV